MSAPSPVTQFRTERRRLGWCGVCGFFREVVSEPDGTQVCLAVCYEARNGDLPFHVTESGRRLP